MAANRFTSVRRRVWVRLLLLGLISSLALSCGDKTENFTLEPNVATPANEPPTIVTQGPAWGAAAIDLDVQPPPTPYVVVADPNGVGDIALALFSIDSAVIHRIVVRPDSVLPGGYCDDITWSDSLDITPLLPAAFTPIIESCPMGRNGTLFSFSEFGWTPYASGGCTAFPAIAAASPYFGRPVKSCGAQYPLSRFGIYPPGVPAAIDVNLTFLDVEYRGIHVTVYDAAGLKATTTFPPLRLVYRTYNEKRSPP
jgi:hypothetical protein